MSETATLRAVDAYLSIIGDVTPSKAQRLGRVQSPTDQVYFLCNFTNLKTALQEEWSPLSLSQFIEAPASTVSEPDEDVRQTAVWLTRKSQLPKAPQFTRQPNYKEGSLEPNEDVWQTAVWLMAKSHTPWSPVSNRLQDPIASQRPPNVYWSFALEDFRRSNLVAFSQPPEQETELTTDEKRYQELNEKYFNGTITKQEQFDLARLEEALDEADAKDPQLMMLNREITAGYDKLHTALRQVNRILDELLTD
jgi:hypothetical protein